MVNPTGVEGDRACECCCGRCLHPSPACRPGVHHGGRTARYGVFRRSWPTSRFVMSASSASMLSIDGQLVARDGISSSGSDSADPRARRCSVQLFASRRGQRSRPVRDVAGGVVIGREVYGCGWGPPVCEGARLARLAEARDAIDFRGQRPDVFRRRQGRSYDSDNGRGAHEDIAVSVCRHPRAYPLNCGPIGGPGRQRRCRPLRPSSLSTATCTVFNRPSRGEFDDPAADEPHSVRPRCVRLRETGPGRGRVPLIAVSGIADLHRHRFVVSGGSPTCTPGISGSAPSVALRSVCRTAWRLSSGLTNVHASIVAAGASATADVSPAAGASLDAADPLAPSPEPQAASGCAARKHQNGGSHTATDDETPCDSCAATLTDCRHDARRSR